MSAPLRDEPELATGRRTFLRWLVQGFLSLWALAAGVVGFTFLKAPEKEQRPGEGIVRGGKFSTLGVGEARFIRHGAEPLYVIRVSEEQVLALPAICTHLRCVLKWNSSRQSFDCPCHNGAFDKNGNVLSGPPTRPLAPLRVEIEADDIVIRS
ncbi:MAG TPA: Rieske 2Fe-2S domain-containing protein [Candidatus Polarisedimenticolia bacterium]|nr:Rieske 2Fe-2S domain-containing protein [Candidatus Polarisedimenticolia bacterium]